MRYPQAQRSIRWGRRVLLPMLCLLFACGLHAADTPRETQLKAAIIVKLLGFVQWPGELDESESSLSLCVLGNTVIEAPLRQLAARGLRGREIEIYRVDSAENERRCQLLYLPPETEDRLFGVLEDIDGRAVLSVSDMNAFAERGGMINIVRRGNSFGFRINLSSAQKARLTISAPLLELADIINTQANR